MAKEVFGEYSAYTTPGGIRFMKAGRLTSENALPPEVVNYLKGKLTGERGTVLATDEPRFPRPSEEELARMRAESVQVPPELQMTPEEVVARTPVEQPVESEPLSPEDFDDTPVHTPLEPTPEQEAQVRELIKEAHTPVIEEPQIAEVEPDFLESVSIYTADLKDIAQALYDRFGIYTVYLGKLPQNDEINPLTATQFTKYHLGIAYQAAIYAQNQGLLQKEPETNRQLIDAGRATTAQTDDVPYTMAENRQADTFAFRTSVRGTQSEAATRIEHVRGEDGQLHAVQVPVETNGEANLNGAGQRYAQNEDEMIVEPPIIGARPVIRPNW